jgi:methionine biosynthesis protein MetW
MLTVMRFDQKIIASWITPGASVLELGCGEGKLLHYLKKRKQVKETGVDFLKSRVKICREKGLSVHQGAIKKEAIDFQENSFDYVILSQSLQQTKEPLELINYLLRIGKKEIISFPNYSNWRVRYQLVVDNYALGNRLPYEWLRIPKSQFMTIKNFSAFTRNASINILKISAIRSNDLYQGGNIIKFMPNLFATNAIFMISRKKPC